MSKYTLRIQRCMTAVLLAVTVTPLTLAAPVEPPTAEQVAELAKQLQSDDETKQGQAAVKLGSMGAFASDAVPALVSRLKSPNQAIQFECTVALGEIGLMAGGAEQALVQLLDQDSAQMQMAVLQSLRRIGKSAPQTVTRVRQLAESDDPGVAAAAIRFLSGTGNLNDAQRKAAIPRLIECLRDSSSTTGRNAAHALADIGDPVVAAVISVLDDDKRTTTLRACHVLGEIGPGAAAATDKLIKVTRSDDALTVRMAAEALGQIGSSPEKVVPILIGLLEHDSAGVRADAADAIGHLGHAASSACTDLCARLKDDSVIVRSSAAAALGRVSTGDTTTTEHLLDAFNDDHGSVTACAANALAEIGAPAVPALVSLLKSNEYRGLAIAVLGEMDNQAETAVPELVELLKTDDEAVQREIFIALASMGPAAKPAAARLTEFLKDESGGLRRRGAAWVLGRIGDVSSASAIRSVLMETDDPLLKRACALALVTLEPDNAEYAQKAVPMLVKALESDDELVRSESVAALGRLGSHATDAVSNIITLANNDSSTMVRSAALHALGELTTDSVAAAQAAVAALSNDDPLVRNAARFLIGSMGPRAKSAAQNLKETMRSGPGFDRIVAAWAIVRIDPTADNNAAAAPLMVKALVHQDPRVRAAGAKTLGVVGIRSPEILEALQKATTDENSEVSAAAKKSLTALKAFHALFNGKDLSGWHGQPHFDPRKLAAMSKTDRDSQVAEWTADANKHWSVEDGELVNDGQGAYLLTDDDFTDYELLIDYKTVPRADSGIYLKNTPQVQIWDYTDPEKFNIGGDKGSGGLWNNSPGAPGKDPSVLADKPFGEWNHFRIRQIGARTSVWLNDELVVDNAIMENFWDRNEPLFPKGPIGLQTHGGEIRWRNILAREIPSDEANAILASHSNEGFQNLFNGVDLTGWAGATDNYEVVDGAIRCKAGHGGILHTEDEYADFVVRLEFKVPPGGNNGLAIRTPGTGDPAYAAMCELQVLDSEHARYATKLDPRQYHGSIYGMVAAKRGFLRPAGEWNFQEVTVDGSRIKVELNGNVILDADVAEVTEFMGGRPHPGATRTKGYFGFAGHNDPVEFRNVSIRNIDHN
jgi:HEAT repeat protein